MRGRIWAWDICISMTGLKWIGPIAPIWALHWSYLLLAVEVHTTTYCRFYREQLRPALELSTLGCSLYTQQHTAGFTGNSWDLHWSYLLLVVHYTHNNTLQVLQRTIAPCAGVIYSWLFIIHTTPHCRFYREQLRPAPPKTGPVTNINKVNNHLLPLLIYI